MVRALALVLCMGLGASVGGSCLGSPANAEGVPIHSGEPSHPSLGNSVENCTPVWLGSVRVSPQTVSVGPSATQTFTGIALSTCGASLTNLTHFSWHLSSSSVGSLGSASGTSVVYTACIAPMEGVLHLVGTFNGTNLTANATIKIAGGSGGGAIGFPGQSSENGGSNSSSDRWMGYPVMVILITGAIVVFLWGRRPERPSSPP